MNDTEFKGIKHQLANGHTVWIDICSGKYDGSVVQAHDTKTHTTYYDGYRGDNLKYEENKIKVKINGRFQWQSAYYVYTSEQHSESIVTRAEQNKKIPPPKDFLGREFEKDNVVFLHSPTYGEILGVVDKINDRGTLTIRMAKKQHEWCNSERAKQGIFMVPHERANRVLIIDDPAVLLLRA